MTFSLPKLKEGAAEKLKMLQAMRGKSLIAKKKGEKDGGENEPETSVKSVTGVSPKSLTGEPVPLV